MVVYFVGGGCIALVSDAIVERRGGGEGIDRGVG